MKKYIFLVITLCFFSSALLPMQQTNENEANSKRKDEKIEKRLHNARSQFIYNLLNNISIKYRTCKACKLNSNYLKQILKEQNKIKDKNQSIIINENATKKQIESMNVSRSKCKASCKESIKLLKTFIEVKNLDINNYKDTSGKTLPQFVNTNKKNFPKEIILYFQNI